MAEMVLGYIPCRDGMEAKKIAKSLLEKKLIACANIIPSINSCYNWKGKMCEETEALLLIKTAEEKKNKVTEEVKKQHSYKVPCIGFLKFDEINKEYEEWLKKELSG